MSSYRNYKRRAQLDELAGLGMDLARDLERRARDARSVKETVELAKLFADTAREVQQTIALANRLEREGRGAAPARPRIDKGEAPAAVAPDKIVKH